MKLLTILLCIVYCSSFGQSYDVALIPDSLTKNANAVLRNEETSVIIKSISKAIIKRKYAITILNENADGYAVYNNTYDDKLISLSDISIALFDAKGNKLKSAKRKDIYDIKDDDGMSFVTDTRRKLFSFQHKTYPYTIEIEDELELTGIYHLPEWVPVAHEHYAVQNSVFTVETPVDYQLRYKAQNTDIKPVIVTGKNTMTYQWSMKNFTAVDFEPKMPYWDEAMPVVILAPTKFSIEGYEGDMSTWKGFGLFHTKLNESRTILPNNLKLKVHELTDNITSDEEKVKVLYNYLQQNTRYISIQLGIGGWQPLPASFVAEKKYGDCKALSNFMVCMLKEAGIKALYTIIKSGEEHTQGLCEDFPANKFNHIITCVPMKNDTMWLECTSQSASAGYMGSFTGNRKALLITEEGGVVVSTPLFKPQENEQIRKITATVNTEGDVIMNSHCIYTGTQQEDAHGLFYNANDEGTRKSLNRMFELPTYSVDKYKFEEIKARNPKMVEDLEITAPLYANITGKRMFIVPNLLNKTYKLNNDKPRRFDIVFQQAFIDRDSIEIKVPAGYTVEAMPKNVEINNKFGRYKINYSFDGNTIKTSRYREQNVQRFAPADYDALVDFYNEMSKADRTKMVLVKAN